MSVPDAASVPDKAQDGCRRIGDSTRCQYQTLHSTLRKLSTGNGVGRRRSLGSSTPCEYRTWCTKRVGG
eukprot:447945-Rhodomonas_salina.4